jgi:hypothetical protein
MAKRKNIKPQDMKFADMGNRPMYDGIVSKYTSGAAGSHDNRPKRERTRSSSKSSAIKSGW